MYISSFRLGLLLFIAIFLGFNVPMLITAVQQGTSLTNPLLNILGLLILGLVIVFNQAYQNRKRRSDAKE